MIKILDSSGMKACDNYTINALGIPSRELMERAAEACVSMISDGRFDLGHVTAVCGTGNNGGDGMAIALMLARRGISVDVVFSGISFQRSLHLFRAVRTWTFCSLIQLQE